MDGYGDDASTSIYTGAGNRVERHWHSSIFNSMGILYTSVTQYLGFAGFSDEGKVMALAAFGDDSLVESFRKIVGLRPTVSTPSTCPYFNFDAYGSLQPFRSKFFDEFGPPRSAGRAHHERHRNVARALQTTLEDVVLYIAQDCLRRYPSRNLVLSGGVWR